MNENENNFEALRRLLTLKRHEMPPPGFFNGFSDQVIARIRAGEAGNMHTAAKRVSGTSWLSNFLQLFEFKPAFAGAFASALCLLLIFGIVYADRPDSGPQPFLTNTDSSGASFAAVTPAAMPSENYAADLMASNNPATSLQPVASFLGSESAFAQPVSFSPSGN
jgi:hypothetical protein